MISKRKSTRQSRLRKQTHLDDLASQVAQLRNENHQILTSLDLTNQRFMVVEAENSVLRAQVGELSHKLESLNKMIEFLNATNGDLGLAWTNFFDYIPMNFGSLFLDYWICFWISVHRPTDESWWKMGG
jgi:hypothetical protein